MITSVKDFRVVVAFPESFTVIELSEARNARHDFHTSIQASILTCRWFRYTSSKALAADSSSSSRTPSPLVVRLKKAESKERGAGEP